MPQLSISSRPNIIQNCGENVELYFLFVVGHHQSIRSDQFRFEFFSLLRVNVILDSAPYAECFFKSPGCWLNSAFTVPKVIHYATRGIHAYFVPINAGEHLYTTPFGKTFDCGKTLVQILS